MNIVVNNREEKYKKVLERKLNVSISTLCINAPKVTYVTIEIIKVIPRIF
jgi:hypothetical protein